EAPVVLWSEKPDRTRPFLALLHGYGADERDLFALARFLPEDFVIAAIRAPLTASWPAPGFAWYPLDDLRTRDASAVTSAAQALLPWLLEQPASSRGLLGFSQGGAVATQALRIAPRELAFVVNLAGYVAPGTLPHDGLLRELRPPLFWGRGSHDDVIPRELVEHSISWLPDHTS